MIKEATHLFTPICLVMVSHCEQLSPMAMLRGGYVYSTVWKQMWVSTNSRLVQKTTLMKRPVWPGRQRQRWLTGDEHHTHSCLSWGTVLDSKKRKEIRPVERMWLSLANAVTWYTGSVKKSCFSTKTGGCGRLPYNTPGDDQAASWTVSPITHLEDNLEEKKNTWNIGVFSSSL